MKSKILAPFASFLSNAPRAAGARIEDGGGDDDERKQRDGESDEDYAKRMEELDEKERAEQEEKEKEAAARRAEEEREREEAERRAAAEGDDDSEDDDGDDATASAARQRERVRCARIMAHGIKLGRARQAGVFAFDTKMSSRAAIAALNAGTEDAPAQPRRASSLSTRMASTSIPSAGAGGVTPKAPSLAEQIVQAGKKRRGEA
ncbi:hypothetical protein KDX27_22770 [Burkholderia cenocepacia]|uniref:hypothetical protein n=1 Tax=Burkholderia cenocepacia TaxID=95486 RepID=UPI001B8F06C4|nr:hypothetical protein [Burkholderia cenocepacia]MBR8027832.1 hypothetical protein [Burkholderia cenocepacia]MBR8170562.1 hypothetical protein [Burkholderia cenocepacia]